MSFVETSSVETELSEAIRAKLEGAQAPLPIGALTKPKPAPLKKMKAEECKAEVEKVLGEMIRLGLVFCHPSGRAGLERYWIKDEKHLLRAEAMHLAALPQTIANLSKGLGKTVKGVDKEFVAAIVHELVGDEQLFVYPPAKKNAGERYGVCPPPPAPLPWQQPKNRKAFDKILADVRKLMEAAQLGPAELIELLRKHLGSPEIQNRNLITERVSPHSSPFVELENLILKAVANATIVSLPELRGSMPSEYRGRAFDEAVLRLAGDDRILVYKDAEDSSFSEAERPGYVQDGSHIYTSIAKRGE